LGKFKVIVVDTVGCESDPIIDSFPLPQHFSRIAWECLYGAGQRITIKNLEFNDNDSTILPINYPILDDVVKWLKNCELIKINLRGHISKSTDTELNKRDLSRRRARQVANYLIKNGISAARLSIEAVGDKYPLPGPQNTKAQRKANQRVEIEIKNENIKEIKDKCCGKR